MSNKLRRLTLLRMGGQLLAWLVAVAGCVASAWFYGTAIDRTGRFPGEPQLSRPLIEGIPTSVLKPPPGEQWAVVPDPDWPNQRNVYAVGPRRENGTIDVRYFFARNGTPLQTYVDQNGKVRWRLVGDDPGQSQKGE